MIPQFAFVLVALAGQINAATVFFTDPSQQFLRSDAGSSNVSPAAATAAVSAATALVPPYAVDAEVSKKVIACLAWLC